MGFVDVQERITVAGNINNAAESAYVNGITAITQTMCLDGIMDCGWDFQPTPVGVAGCPASSLAAYIED